VQGHKGALEVCQGDDALPLAASDLFIDEKNRRRDEMKKQHELGSASHYDDGASVGLGELGAAGEMSELWGAAIGGGLSTVGAIAARQIGARTMAPGLVSWSEGIGFAAGALGSAALYLTGNKGAAWVGLASSFLNGGLRQIEALMFGGGLSGVVIQPERVLRGANSGMGLVDIEPTQALMGAGGGLGRGEMPQLVGANLQQASKHIQLVGGPALDEHASAWGATHFSHA
jgi:hypothetical protein